MQNLELPARTADAQAALAALSPLGMPPDQCATMPPLAVPQQACAAATLSTCTQQRGSALQGQALGHMQRKAARMGWEEGECYWNP